MTTASVYVACDTYTSVDFLPSPHICPEDGECKGHQKVEETQHKMRLSNEVTGTTQATANINTISYVNK